MTYEELKINLDIYDPEDVLYSTGRQWYSNGRLWFVVCDEGDCHLFKDDGMEDDIRKVDMIVKSIIRKDIKKIIIPDSVMSIEGSAFWGCSELTNVTIPNSVTRICDYAFYRCSSLTNVTIPDSVISIGNFVFKGCSGLTSVVIPNDAEIRYSAFDIYNKVKSFFFFNGKTPNKVKKLEDNYPWGIDDIPIIKYC